MTARFVQRTALGCLLLFLGYVLLFSGPSEEIREPPIRELKNIPLDDMVWRYIYGVRSCLRSRTDPIESQLQPFYEYWRRLPVLSDECSVNAQMSIRSYPTKHKFNFYFVPNMNRTFENEKCTAVSFVGQEFPELSRQFKRENPNCRLVEYSPVEHGDRVEDVARHLNPLLRVNTLFVSPSSVDSHAMVDLLSSDSPLTARVCQINLLYPEPSARRESQFVEVFNNLLTGGRFLLLRAEKDFSSTLMNLFLVNFEDEFCRKRYFRMYTFD